MIYNSYDDELDLLIAKVEGESNDEWAELVDELGQSCHPDTLRKSFAVGRYSGYKVAKYYRDKIENELYSGDELDRIQEKKDDLYKERCRLQDARREYNKVLREEARFENLNEVMRECCNDLPELKVRDCEHENGFTSVEASLILSDLHYGMICDNVLNYYDCEVAKDKLSQLCEKVIYYCRMNLVNTLHINLAGDLIAGTIHLQNRVEAEEDCITQIMEVGELLSQFIVKIAEVVPNIKVYGVIGNHSRADDKKVALNVENYERLIFDKITYRTGITVQLNGLEDWVSYNIGDKLVYVSHGDRDSITSVKANAVNLLGQVPDICYLGHIHHLNVKDDNGTMIVVNGSIISVDSYAMGLRKTSSSYQVMQIFGQDIQTIKIELK